MTEEMDTTQRMLTIKLKLHNPSTRKCEILDEALDHYTRACEFLLHKARVEIDAIREGYADQAGRFRANRLVAWMDKQTCKQLNVFGVEPFKDSIKIDVAAMLASYLALSAKRDSTPFPSLQETDSSKKGEKFRPIFFCRTAPNRNFSILFNPENKRFYAKLYLMNQKNRKENDIAAKADKVLVYISKHSQLFQQEIGKKSYLLFPLSFGKWQEAYLLQAINEPELIKTARLAKKGKNYFLSVNLCLKNPEPILTFGYIGIARGVRNRLNYSIVNGVAELIDSGTVEPGSADQKSQMHRDANFLIELARKFKCRMILEKLKDRSDGLAFPSAEGNYSMPVLGNYEYNGFCELLSSKAAAGGLPQPVFVSAVNLFCTCTYCGKASKANRFSSELIICTNCGRTMDVEKAGSENLARRILQYNKNRIKIDVIEDDGAVRFVNKDLEFDFKPQNPYDCNEEFAGALKHLIDQFYVDIEQESRKANFMKKFSFIKKLQASSQDDILSALRFE